MDTLYSLRNKSLFPLLTASCCSVTKSCLTLCDPWTTAGLLCPSLAPRVCSNSCPLSQWCYLTISSSVIPFSSCLQSFPASESFLMSQFFDSGGQSIGASASASVLLINIQAYFPSGLRFELFVVQGLSRVFSSTTLQKHQFFDTQSSL